MIGVASLHEIDTVSMMQLTNCQKVKIANGVMIKNFESWENFIESGDTDHLWELPTPLKYENFTYVSGNASRQTLHRCIHSRLHQCHNNFFHFDMDYLRNHVRLLLRVVLIITPVKKFLCSTYLSLFCIIQ